MNEQVTGTFVRECFHNDTGWGICIYEEKESGTRFSASGTNLPQVENLPVVLYGKWTTYKEQKSFKVSCFVQEPPSGKNAIVSYLCSLKCGISKSVAEKLWQRYGDDLLDVVQTEPKQVKRIARRCNLEKLREKLAETQMLRELIEYLGPDSTQLSMQSLRRIVETYRERTMERVRANPYVLTFVNGFGFAKTDQIAAKHGVADNARPRIIAAILYALKITNGHVFCKREALIAQVQKLCRTGGRKPPDGNSINVCIDRLARTDLLHIEKVNHEDAIYSIEMYREECRLANNITRLLNGTPEGMFEDDRFFDKRVDLFLQEYEAKEVIKLAERQRQAVKWALKHPLSIITGGAGTGKTTVIKCLVWILEKESGLNRSGKMEKPIRLMAPTGRAARRMSEVTGLPAQTVHKAASITVDEDGVSRHIEKTDGEGNPVYGIDASTVIVDEMSMLDQFAAEELLDQIDQDTRVVLIGDPGQLPSVGPGNVLREMIASGKIPVTKLDVIFRQDHTNPIVHNSLMIQEGNGKDLIWNKKFQMHQCHGAQTILDQAVHFYLRCVKQFGIDDVVLLNPYRKGNLTVDMFNERIQNIVNPLKDNSPYMQVGRTKFRAGDRVMQTRNKDSGVANGDVGVITSVETRLTEDGEKETVCFVQFDEILEMYNSKDMESIQLAYCTSVHKSQGSEYKIVILIMFPEHRALLQRNLLYTGITRAKEGIAIFGEYPAMQQAINTNTVFERNTLLAERIKKSIEKNPWSIQTTAQAAN